MSGPPVFNGQPEEQLPPYFISTDFSEFSKRTKSRLSLQLHLEPEVLKQKRWQISPLPHLLMWHHKLEDVLLQIKPTDLQFMPSLYDWCALKYAFFQNLSRDRHSNYLGGRLWGDQQSHVTWVKLQVIAFPKLREVAGEQRDLQHCPCKHPLPAFGVSTLRL